MSVTLGMWFGFVVGTLFVTGLLWIGVDECRRHSATGECTIRMELTQIILEQTKHTAAGISQ